MAKTPKNVIPIEAIKVDKRLEFIEELMSANPSENGSEVHKMIKRMVFDKASRQEKFIGGGRSTGAKAKITPQILAVLKSHPNKSAKELHKVCIEQIPNFEMEFDSFKTRISELRAEHQIPKVLKKDGKK